MRARLALAPPAPCLARDLHDDPTLDHASASPGWVSGSSQGEALPKKKGLTQEAIAHVADVHPPWVSRLEGGRLNPSWGMVERVAEALGVSTEELAKVAQRFK